MEGESASLELVRDRADERRFFVSTGRSISSFEDNRENVAPNALELFSRYFWKFNLIFSEEKTLENILEEVNLYLLGNKLNLNK